MIRKCTLFFALSLFSLATLSAPPNGEVRETENGIEVWHMAVSGWISPKARTPYQRMLFGASC